MSNNLKKANILKTAVAFLVVAIMFSIGSAAAYHRIDEDAVAVISRVGSRGTEVKKIQTRLKDWGYYKGSVDGIYGAKTKDAVVLFQKKNGLTPDGIAGAATLRAIGISSTSGGGSSSGYGKYSSTDYNLLARVISAESRGEPYTGQVAVGAVILNRVEHPSFPNTLSGVIYQPGAFTCITDGQINAAVTESSYRAAQDAINGMDPSNGCIYYYNPATAKSAWIWSRPIHLKIGKHNFCI